MAETETRGTLKFPVTVERVVERHLQEAKLKKALLYIGAAAKRNKTYNFDVTIPRKNIHITPVDDGSGIPKYRYTAVITVYKENYRSPGAVREQFDNVLGVMQKAANRFKWRIVGEGVLNQPDEPTVDPTVNGQPTEAPKGKTPKLIKSRTDVVLPELTPEVYATHFGRLYNREPQIRIIYDSINMAVRTGFRERHHILLRGLAACAKTETYLGFVDWFSPSMVWRVDATTLTKAGLETELLKKSVDGTLPPIVLIEEIEKVVHEDNVSCLLQVMDVRGMIQRTNARSGDVYGECKVVVWATCNDSKHLRTFHDGALWSRFSLRPICKRPDRELMRKILLRTVHETNGREEWIDPVLTFMWDKLKGLPDYKQDYNDPRLGRALLAGGDRLLDTGAEGFFADFMACCEGKEEGEEGLKGEAALA